MQLNGVEFSGQFIYQTLTEKVTRGDLGYAALSPMAYRPSLEPDLESRLAKLTIVIAPANPEPSGNLLSGLMIDLLPGIKRITVCSSDELDIKGLWIKFPISYYVDPESSDGVLVRAFPSKEYAKMVSDYETGLSDNRYPKSKLFNTISRGWHAGSVGADRIGELTTTYSRALGVLELPGSNVDFGGSFRGYLELTGYGTSKRRMSKLPGRRI